MNKRLFKEYFLISLGTLIVSFSIYYFMVPEHLATGGVSGLSIVITHYLPISVSIINMALNVILLIIGFIFIGQEFGGKTIYSVLFMSICMYIMEYYFPAKGPMTDNTLLNLLCGIIISAMGLSLVFNQNSSTGGTDIIARILNKYFNFDMGKGLMAADIIVVVSAFFTYGIQTGILGAFGWFINGVVVNYFIDGFSVKYEVMIITDKPSDVKEYIFSKLERGVTVYKAQGGYTSKNKDIIVTTLERRQYFLLKKKLKEIDPNMFVIVRNVQEVIGDGFAKF